MYEFRDIADHSEHTTSLPAEAVSVNGVYIENILDGYRTLYTKGRESLGAELNTYAVGTADGERYVSRRYPARTITVGFQLVADSPQDFREKFTELNNLLSLDEADFVFNDESDKFFAGVPIMDASVEEGQLTVKGEWKIHCSYPFKRSVEPVEITSDDEGVVIDGNTATFQINYTGSAPSRPLLVAEFQSGNEGGAYNEDGDCGFVAFMDEDENIIQLGNPDIVDTDEYNRNSTIANKVFENTTGWLTSGGYTWYNRAITGTMSCSNGTDIYWDGGKGQTQKYAKPNYGTGTGWRGATLRYETEVTNFDVQLVHRMAVHTAKQLGAFECSVRNGATVVVGFTIDKVKSGTMGTVNYIINNKIVGKDNIDLSYYNTHLGYCKRTSVYVNQNYKVKVKKPKKVNGQTKTVIAWESRVRKVQTYKYTQSNLNSFMRKNNGVASFKIGNLPQRNFNASVVNETVATSLQMYFGGYNTPLHTNMIHSVCFRSLKGIPFAEQSNVFTAGDIVEADCNDATVCLYRNGTLGGQLAPMYGAFGNDWENFTLTTGENVIRAMWSDWVNANYKPKIRIIYNEVYI